MSTRGGRPSSGTEQPDLWREEGAPYEALVRAAGADAVRKAEVVVTLAHIDRAWSDYLSFVADVREGIHLVGLGGEDPLTRFKVQAAEAFVGHAGRRRGFGAGVARPAGAGREGLDLSHLDLKGPASTWTYLVNDDPFRNQLGMMLTGPGKATFAVGAAMSAGPLLILLGLVDRYLRKRPHAR